MVLELQRGVAHGKLRQYDRAIADYDEAICLNPQYAEAYYNRGAGYGAIGRSIQAERDFAKAKDLGHPPLGYTAPRGMLIWGIGDSWPPGTSLQHPILQ